MVVFLPDFKCCCFYLDNERQVTSKIQNDWVLLSIPADPLYLSPVCFIAFLVHLQVHWKVVVKGLLDTRRVTKVFWLCCLSKGGIKLVSGKIDGKQATSTGNEVFSQHTSKKRFQFKLRCDLQVILFFLFRKRQQAEKMKYCFNLLLEMLYLYYAELEKT